ncbi:MAG: hypothetical protein J6B59_03525 [Alistipes sp.]|nr:hypothetical protein [Alistipes sp.]
MELKKVQTELRRLAEMAEAWHTTEEVSAIERDLMLARLRDLYAMIRFEVGEACTSVMGEAEAVEPKMDEEMPAMVAAPLAAVAVDDTAVSSDTALSEEPQPQVEEEFVALDAEAFLSLDTLVASEPAPASEPEPEPAPESVPAPESKAAPEPMASMAQSLFGEEEVVVRHRHKQRVIMSLYDEPVVSSHPALTSQPVPRAEEIVPAESELVAVACEPEVIEVTESELEEPMEEPKVEAVEAPSSMGDMASSEVETEAPAAGTVLGEVIAPVQTLADTIAPPRDVASELRHREPITDLRRAVGLNDKFLLIRDLFNGNGALYEITIRRLNEFDNFDDCMIYIAEHFAWNPNSDGAKLMMELLERKFEQA